MSTPSSDPSKPNTRSSKRKTEGKRDSLTGASPILPAVGRKRKNSAELLEGPQAKRMAENQLLEAINGIKTSVAAMENQLRTVPTKNDLGAIVSEIRGVRETVIRNKDRIDTLFDLRKEDQRLFNKKVERIVESQGSSKGAARSSDNEQNFLKSRRSVRLWPVNGTDQTLEKNTRGFLRDTLKMPESMVESLRFEKIQPASQARRSKIQGEVILQLRTSQERDSIQSYASNLAAVQGQAGIRLDIPDFLRGIFRQFEMHAADLKAQYGSVKRAIRFDDVEQSLYMDVKLDSTDWHRITAKDMSRIHKMKKKTPSNSSTGSRTEEERRKIFMLPDGQGDIPLVETDEEDFADASDNASK